jgi:hypothetical protein
MIRLNAATAAPVASISALVRMEKLVQRFVPARRIGQVQDHKIIRGGPRRNKTAQLRRCEDRHRHQERNGADVRDIRHDDVRSGGRESAQHGGVASRKDVGVGGRKTERQRLESIVVADRNQHGRRSQRCGARHRTHHVLRLSKGGGDERQEGQYAYGDRAAAEGGAARKCDVGQCVDGACGGRPREWVRQRVQDGETGNREVRWLPAGYGHAGYRVLLDLARYRVERKGWRYSRITNQRNRESIGGHLRAVDCQAGLPCDDGGVAV